jgi:hemerythrin-like domain-containing protein
VTTDPLRRFEAEHDVALAALGRLEHAALQLREDGPRDAPLAVARDVQTLLAGTVRDHNESEERALFPFLGSDAPLGPFLEEHQTLWGLEERLARAIEGRDGLQVADLSLEIVDLLRGHIQRENEVLFPMARTLLGPEGLAAVARVLDSQPSDSS